MATNCPTELKRREDRLAKIREAKARLEAEARAKAEEEQRRRDEEQAQREAEGRKRRGKEPAPIDPTPEDKAQTNFTDPEAKIMKQSNKGFDYSYNAQAVVDGEDQIIVAAEVTKRGQRQAAGRADGAERPWTTWRRPGSSGRRGPTARRRRFRTRRTPATSAKKRSRGWRRSGIDPHIAVERQKHHEVPVESEATSPSPAASAKEKMQEKLRSATGKALYAARKHIVEPVFGQIKSARGIREFLLRGLEKVSAEWQLICLTHNLLKIWRRSCSAGVS